MNVRIFAAVAAAFVVLALATPASQAAREPQLWDYTNAHGLAGPADWGTLPGDALCSTGKRQSPIDLQTAQIGTHPELPELAFHYRTEKLNLDNNGHTIQMDFSEDQPAPTLSVADDSYRLKQFHFHAPSENTLDGKHFPMELHLVHLNDYGKPAVVVAVFIKEGKHNKALEKLFESFPSKKGEIVMDAHVKVDPTALLPSKLTYYKFAGSLTTPPCKEGLTWYVLESPIELDAKQIREFTSIPGFDHTNRPVQPVGGRKVQKSK